MENHGFVDGFYLQNHEKIDKIVDKTNNM